MSTNVKPTFSMPFIYFLTARLSEALEARLKARRDLRTLRMLNCLTALIMFPQQVKGGKVGPIWDGDIVGVVGQVTRMLEFE